MRLDICGSFPITPGMKSRRHFISAGHPGFVNLHYDLRQLHSDPFQAIATLNKAAKKSWQEWDVPRSSAFGRLPRDAA